MSELQRLKNLLPPENESWVFVEAAAAIDPPLITLEEIGRDEVEIQIDLDEWDNFAIDHRNLLFWHEVGKIQNDTIPRDGWEMAALAIGLGGAIGELWVQDGLLLLLALGLSSFAGFRLYLKNNSEKKHKKHLLSIIDDVFNFVENEVKEDFTSSSRQITTSLYYLSSAIFLIEEGNYCEDLAYRSKISELIIKYKIDKNSPITRDDIDYDLINNFI